MAELLELLCDQVIQQKEPRKSQSKQYLKPQQQNRPQLRQQSQLAPSQRRDDASMAATLPERSRLEALSRRQRQPRMGDSNTSESKKSINSKKTIESKNVGKGYNVANTKNRYIPIKIKQEVYSRDGGCCSYKSSQTKIKCQSKHLLQYDHIRPLAFGGQTTVDNLRLLCFQHHKLITEKVFGKQAK
jgi:hypothetical protein